MRKKHKPPHAGTAVMFAATLVVILLISQDRNNKVLRLEAEIRQEVESRSAQARQEALAGSIQVLQYRYIKDCPLPKKVQREIFHICEESGWDSECISDNGESVGLMQIQKRWHAELMDKTGCTDLTDPVQNVRVGTALLKRHFRTYQDPAWALMAYNGGQAYADRMIEQNKTSAYAERILRRAAAYERSNSI